jgi:hypothetical protein
MRTRFALHKEHELGHHTELSLKFIPADDIRRSNASIVVMGIKKHVTSWMSAESAIGWTSANNEPLVEVSLIARHASLWASLTYELCPKSMHGYWFVQGEYALRDNWLYAGLEHESWGSYAHHTPWSLHTGPNLIFRFKSIEFDLALHTDNNFATEMVTRIHLFL